MISPRMLLGMASVLCAVLAGMSWYELDEVERRSDERIRESVRARKAAGVGHQHAESRHVSTRGEEIVLGVSDRPTQLLFFSPQCPGCRASAPTWNALARRLDRQGVRFVGMAAPHEGLEPFCSEFALEFPIVVDEGAALQKELGVEAWPERVQLDRRGTVVARDAQLVILDAHASDWQGVMAEWGPELQARILKDLVTDDVQGVRAVVTVPLGPDGVPRLVFEGDTEALGFGAVLARPSDRPECSPLDCLVVLGTSGELRAVIPLRVHTENGERVDRVRFEEWCEPRVLRAGAGCLELSFVSELQRLRTDFGFPRAITGVDTSTH